MKSVAAFVPVGLFLLVLGGCATGDPATQSVPRNYRHLIAQNVKASKDHSTIISAQISPPGIWQGPMGLGGDRPIACAKLTVPGPFANANPQSYYVGYTFQSGSIAEVFYPESVYAAGGNPVGAALKTAVTCGKLTYTSFAELGKR